jgi:hypothetical protein
VQLQGHLEAGEEEERRARREVDRCVADAAQRENQLGRDGEGERGQQPRAQIACLKQSHAGDDQEAERRQGVDAEHSPGRGDARNQSEVAHRAAAPHVEDRRPAATQSRGGALVGPLPQHRLSIHGEDLVAGAQARPVGRQPRAHFGHHDPGRAVFGMAFS